MASSNAWRWLRPTQASQKLSQPQALLAILSQNDIQERSDVRAYPHPQRKIFSTQFNTIVKLASEPPIPSAQNRSNRKLASYKQEKSKGEKEAAKHLEEAEKKGTEEQQKADKEAWRQLTN